MAANGAAARKRAVGVAACVGALLTCETAFAKPPRPATLRMTATAYCEHGPTKSGVRPRNGVVAADPRRLPLGTRLRIVAPGQPHDGTYVVADTGSAIRGRDLDIFMPSCRRAKAFGRRAVVVRVLERGSGPKDARDKIVQHVAR